MTSSRGSALLGVLLVLGALLPLGAFVVLQSSLQARIGRNLRQRAAAFYAAEAGLVYAVASAEHAADAGTWLAGTDRQTGTADDGVIEIPISALDLGREQERVEIRAVRDGESAVRLLSTGYAGGSAAGLVGRLSLQAPTSPAAVVLEGALRADTSTVAIDGIDSTATPPVAAIGVAGEAVIDPPDPRAQPLRAVAVTERAATLRRHPQARVVMAAALGALGTSTSPAITIVEGDWDLEVARDGYGFLVVDGNLRLAAELRMKGALIVLGRVEVDGGRLDLDGTLWVANDLSPGFELAGSRVHFDAAPLARSEQALPGSWPRAMKLTGWQEMR